MKNSSKEFSKEWWKEFLSATSNFTKPCSMNERFSDKTSDALLESTLSIFKDFDNSALFRIWVNGEKREDLHDVVMKNPPLEGDTLETWTNRIFGKQKFGIIFNEGERWSKEFNIDLYEKVKPLLEQLGYPMMGMDVTVFVGNYGWTPLGIHMDYLGESVLHFHMGPAQKNMYIWDKDEYMKDLKGKLGEKRPEFYVDKATKYEINKGGMFYMPWGHPHVGKTDELSAAISIWFNKPTKLKILNRVLNNVKSEYLGEQKTFIEEHLSFENDSQMIETIDYQKDPIADIFDDIIQDLDVKSSLEKFSFLDLLKMNTKDFQYALKSNLNFSYPINENAKNKDVKILEESFISLDNPYKIEWYHSDISNKLHLFIKGKKTMLIYHEDIVHIIEKLNEFKTYKVKDLIEGLFSNWPKEASLRIIEILYENHGLLIQNTEVNKELDTMPQNALITTK